MDEDKDQDGNESDDGENEMRIRILGGDKKNMIREKAFSVEHC